MMLTLKPLINWTPELYDRLSKQYDRLANLFFPIGDLGRKAVVSDLSSGSILDVACGTGILLEKAYQRGLTCVGIDTSWGMLAETKKKVPAAAAVQASFYALPFTDQSFDFVVETNAVSGADIHAEVVLREMLRVCAAGGEIRIGDYGRTNRQGFWIWILEKIGILIGDYPHNYPALFRSEGIEAEVEQLGWGGMYQFVKVKL
jgi:ubiquinone/menaquinone biosynthesis C-methylase UbiE